MPVYLESRSLTLSRTRGLFGHGSLLILLALFALLKPLWLRPFYNVWMRISMAIGAVVSRIIIAAVFFLVVTPTGLIMRACGTDPMRRKLDRETPSYKEAISENKSNSFNNPF